MMMCYTSEIAMVIMDMVETAIGATGEVVTAQMAKATLETMGDNDIDSDGS